MNSWLAAVQIIGGPVPLVVYGLAVVAFLFLAVRRMPDRRERLRWSLTALIAIGVGTAAGLVACWLVSDVYNTFDVSLSPISRAWVCAALAGIALAVVSLLRARARRRVVAVGGMILFLLAGALGVNADFGQYTTLGSIAGTSAFSPLPDSVLSAQRAGAGSAAEDVAPLWKTWNAPSDLPARGTVGEVTIPATVSGFAARTALVYLPPAALVSDHPALPVLVMLSGQPGSPENVFLAGHLDTLLDSMAAENHGLAPIVVVPDQLSAPNVNPMCVDSAIGNSATYLTVDVPAWIRANLDVEPGPTTWAIGGFSQGGTCAIQLGAAHPELFGSILDVSGELFPKNGTPQQTIDQGFAGNAAAYEAAKPLAVLAAHAPYSNTVGVFGVGSLDSKYTPFIDQVSNAAAQAGVRTTVLHSPGTAHDWATVRYVFQHGLPEISRQMGLVAP